MDKIMFDSYIGLEHYVLVGEKTMTRRLVSPKRQKKLETASHLRSAEAREEVFKKVLECAPFKVGNIVAIAQSYETISRVMTHEKLIEFEQRLLERYPDEYSAQDLAGWRNKMYVISDFMPYRIRITGVKLERLQDISEEDCLKEGIEHDVAEGDGLYWYSVCNENPEINDDRKLQDKFMRHEWNGRTGDWFWDTAQGAFSALINYISPKIDGKPCWDANPWVYAYEFELVKF